MDTHVNTFKESVVCLCVHCERPCCQINVCLFVRFIACFKQEAEFADRLVRPGRLGVSFGWNGATVIGSLGAW